MEADMYSICLRLARFRQGVEERGDTSVAQAVFTYAFYVQLLSSSVGRIPARERGLVDRAATLSVQNRVSHTYSDTRRVKSTA